MANFDGDVIVTGGNFINNNRQYNVIRNSSADIPKVQSGKRGRWMKRNDTLKTGDVIFKYGKPDDIIIPIMGRTGVGKSTFVNRILGGSQAKVGEGLESCTTEIQHFVLDIPSSFPLLQGRRLVIVDTIGFEDTYISDTEVLRRVSAWLAYSYASRMEIGGVVYLHDISLPLSLGHGQTRKSIDVFRALCGRDALSAVVFATSKWAGVDTQEAKTRENKLCNGLWRDFIAAGASVRRFENTQVSSWNIVNTILHKVQNTLHVDSLRIQAELVDHLRGIPETDAGRLLCCQLQNLLDQRRRLARTHAAASGHGGREGDLMLKAVAELEEQLAALKIGLPRRLMIFLGLA